jgi:hypothetical protein
LIPYGLKYPPPVFARVIEGPTSRCVKCGAICFLPYCACLMDIFGLWVRDGQTWIRRGMELEGQRVIANRVRVCEYILPRRTDEQKEFFKLTRLIWKYRVQRVAGQHAPLHALSTVMPNARQQLRPHRDPWCRWYYPRGGIWCVDLKEFAIVQRAMWDRTLLVSQLSSPQFVPRCMWPDIKQIFKSGPVFLISQRSW